MNEKKYVQYKNDPNGTKWKVADELPTYWRVDGGNRNGLQYVWELPKSDYIPCAPPERWTNITKAIEWSCITASPTPTQCEFVLPQHCRAIRVPVMFADGTKDEAIIVEKRED
jgi:hypothetical protein